MDWITHVLAQCAHVLAQCALCYWCIMTHHDVLFLKMVLPHVPSTNSINETCIFNDFSMRFRMQKCMEITHYGGTRKLYINIFSIIFQFVLKLFEFLRPRDPKIRNLQFEIFISTKRRQNLMEFRWFRDRFSIFQKRRVGPTLISRFSV